MGKRSGPRKRLLAEQAACDHDASQWRHEAIAARATVLHPGRNTALLSKTFPDIWNVSPPGTPPGISRQGLPDVHRDGSAGGVIGQRSKCARQLRRNLLAWIGKDLKNPMSGILGMAELLARSELDLRQKTFVGIIVKSANAALTTINDILDFSRIDAGEITLDPAPFNLPQAVEDVAGLVCMQAWAKNLELVIRVQPGLHGEYAGDSGRFRQIVANLLGNAVQFTDSGHVLIDVAGDDSGEDSALHIAITDTGIGIAQDRLAGIFDGPDKIDPATGHRHHGAGLGLAIAAGLVAMMGGRIGAESREGKGSTFKFSIRLPRASGPDRQPAVPAQMSGARILIVDDNAISRSVLMEQMQNWGFDACAAQNGAEGLAVLRAAAALGLGLDCLILDHDMPAMTGAQMAHIVRASPHVASLPIILLTSIDPSLNPTGRHDPAIDRHLMKPACPSALLEAVIAAVRTTG